MSIPETSTGITAARRAGTRRGFSLVELLVVIGIIATMLALVLGGFFRSRDGNRLLAAEQVLADAIRQARHTARSTGMPVELRLTPVVNGSEVVGARLAGVSRTVLWSETFDKARDLDDDGTISVAEEEAVIFTDGSDGVVIGRSGNGRMASAVHPIRHELTRGTRLVRGGRSDGFFLACSVLPPRTITNNAILPLVVVGSADGRAEQAQCALYLRGQVPPPDQGRVPVWELLGAVWSSDVGNEVSISSHTHQITRHLSIPDPTLPNGAPDIVNPITGGQWLDLALLYDGRRMLLYRDGERIAELRSGVPATLRAEGDHVHVGMIHLPAEMDPTYAAAPLDDVRLHRLGTGDAGELPGNVVLVDAPGARPVATIGWRILCQPDGRVEVGRDDDSDATPVNDRVTTVSTGPRTGDTATILLGQLRSPGMITNAELTVTLDGRVQSRLIADPPPGAAQ